MADEAENDETATPEQLLRCIASLPDRKVSAGKILHELDDSVCTISDALNELLRLGEIELCQMRGTGPRVWYKHRNSSGKKPPGRVAGTVWRCYVAEDSSTRMAERLFHHRDEAFNHLWLSAAVRTDLFEEVPYLDGVWRATIDGFEGYGENTAVVRKEPVYALSSDSDGTSAAVRKHGPVEDEKNDQLTLSDSSDRNR